MTTVKTLTILSCCEREREREKQEKCCWSIYQGQALVQWKSLQTHRERLGLSGNGQGPGCGVKTCCSSPWWSKERVEIVILNAMCLWLCQWHMNNLRRLNPQGFAISPLWSLDISWCVLYDCVKYFHYTRRETSKQGGKAIVFVDCSADRVLEVYLNSSVLFALWLVAAADHYMLLLLCQQWSLYSGDSSSILSFSLAGWAI